MDITPEFVWNAGPGTPMIKLAQRQNGAFDIVIDIDGGYSLHSDAQEMAEHWAEQLTRAGLKTDIHPLARSLRHLQPPQNVEKETRAEKTIPTATAIKIIPNRTFPGAHIVTVTCPYCTKNHSHGVQSLNHDGGHRVADCWDTEAQKWNSKGYFVYIPDHLVTEGI